MSGEGGLTPKHLKKVAEKIGELHPLGIQLDIPSKLIDKLVRPLEGHTQNAAKMFNIWYDKKGYNDYSLQTTDKLKEELCSALQEEGRNDLVAHVKSSELQDANAVQKLFQYMSQNLTHKWKEIGINLGMVWNDLNAIGPTANPNENPGLTMLQIWHEKTEPEDQCAKMFTALTNLGRADIINDIGLGPADEIDSQPLPPGTTSRGTNEPRARHRGAQAHSVPKIDSANIEYHKELDKGLEHMLGEAAKARKIVVAILDTGIYTAHPRLKDHIIDSHNCFPGGDGDLHQDKANHGTLSAGLVVQYAEHCVEIINVKVNGDYTAQCTEDYPHIGFQWIEEWEKSSQRKVDIVLTSIGAANYEYMNQEACSDTLYQLGKTKVVIAAAANEGNKDVNTVAFPASHDSVLAIGSQNGMGNISDFSSRGEKLNFMFRGEDFTSTSRPPHPDEKDILIVQDSGLPGDFMKYSAGTSFAAPHAAAAIANILAYTDSTCGPVYRAALTNTASMKELLIKVSKQKHKRETGYGFPDLDLLQPGVIQAKTRSMYSYSDWADLETKYGGRTTV